MIKDSRNEIHETHNMTQLGHTRNKEDISEELKAVPVKRNYHNVNKND